ncbi:E3 ubiquitin-protein ligase MARCHF8 [Taenia solium]
MWRVETARLVAWKGKNKSAQEDATDHQATQTLSILLTPTCIMARKKRQANLGAAGIQIAKWMLRSTTFTSTSQLCEIQGGSGYLGDTPHQCVMSPPKGRLRVLMSKLCFVMLAHRLRTACAPLAHRLRTACAPLAPILSLFDGIFLRHLRRGYVCTRSLNPSLRALQYLAAHSAQCDEWIKFYDGQMLRRPQTGMQLNEFTLQFKRQIADAEEEERGYSRQSFETEPTGLSITPSIIVDIPSAAIKILRSSLSRTSTTSTVPIKLTLHGDGNPQKPAPSPITFSLKDRHSQIPRPSSTTFSPYLPFCRICHDTDVDSCGPLIAPCLCDGSLKYVHQTCLQHWIDISQLKKCELCHFEFEMRKCPKPNTKQVCCVLSREQLYLLSAFEPTILLLAALAIWWFVFTFSHSTVPIPPASMSLALYVAAVVVAFTFFHFVGLFVCWIVYFCKYERRRRQSEYVDMVQEPSRQRIASARIV